MQKLSTLEHDILTEVATMGFAHAAGSVTRMLKQKVSVNVPKLEIIQLEKVPGLMGEPEQTMTVVIVKIKGDAAGIIMLIMTPENAALLVSEIAAGQADSALEEVVNIFSGASLGALTRFLGISLMQSIPGSATDMLRAVINEAMSGFGEKVHEVLLLTVDFTVANLNAAGKLYFIFDDTSTEKIIAACQKQIENGNNASN
jgi:chemotaxis protein CheC